MSHHSLRRALGTWIGVVTSADLEFFDAAQYASIDGDAGGTWNPTAYIMLGGTFGLRIGSTANLWVDGTSYLYGNVTCGTTADNTFECEAGLARFHEDLATDGNITSHGTLNSDGNCDLCTNSSNTHLVRGTATFQENVTCNKQVTITQGVILGTPGVHTYDITCASNLISNGTTYLNGHVDFAAGQTCTWRGDTVTSGASVFNGTIETNAKTSMWAPLEMRAGGYIQSRILHTDTGYPSVNLKLNDVYVCSAADVIYLESEGDDGGTVRIVNVRNQAVPIQTAGGGHLLRTLPANTWILLERTSTSGSFGWGSLGEGPYVALV